MGSSIARRQQIKAQIHELLDEYFDIAEPPFDPATHQIALSEPTYDGKDVAQALEPLLTGWPTIGSKVREVEDKIATLLRVKHAIMVNSGGSANFLCFYLLASPYARPERRLRPGDEVITPAVTWSTTVSPIIQAGCVPVLVDVNLGTYDIDVEQIELNITDKTRALMIVHPLGHACEMKEVLAIAEKHNLIVIEDTCESLGTTYDGRFTGTFGDFGTFSFYFSHQVTSIEGGVIVTEDDLYADVLRSMRANGWYREIRDESLRQRTEQENRHLETTFLFPFIGFNLKPTDVGAGLVLHQLDRLEDLLQARSVAANYLTQRLQKYSDFLHLPYVRQPCRHGWFSYAIVVRDNAPFTSAQLTGHLKRYRIDSRPIIAGNIAVQPFLRNFQVRKGELANSNRVMRNGFFLGIHHKMDNRKLKYVADAFDEFFDAIP